MRPVLADTVSKVEKVIELILTPMTLVEACRITGIDHVTVFRTLEKLPDLRNAYIRAREGRAELYVDQLIDIADNQPDVNRARVQVDTRKWIASKHDVKTYGDRIDLTVNHVVDIGSALSEAKQRLVVNVPEQIPLTQDVDIIEQMTHDATDYESVDDDSEKAIDLSSSDIFK